MASTDSRWKLAAGTITVGATALLVLWRRVFRAKPEPVKQKELDAVQSKSIELSDGRVLQYYEFGAADGRPTIMLHGMVATGRRFQWWEHEFSAMGIRAICPSLPGWGLSDPVRDRRLVDYPSDIKQLADHLKLEKFDIIGVSFGGMHAAAVAAKLHDRVMRCALLGAHCPNDVAGVDITHGMNHLFRYSARMIRFAPFLADPLAYTMKLMFRLTDARKASAQITFSSPDYRYIMDWPEHKQYEMTNFFGDIMAESMSRTHFGHSDCGRLAVLQPWGFSPSEIRCPTLIVAANEDDSTPSYMQRELARLIPNNRLICYRGGHLIFNVLFPIMLNEWIHFALDGRIDSSAPTAATGTATGSTAFASAMGLQTPRSAAAARSNKPPVYASPLTMLSMSSVD